MSKNPAAVALGKQRWAGSTPKERSEQMDVLRAKARKKMSKAARVARATKASKAAAIARKKKAAEKKSKNPSP